MVGILSTMLLFPILIIALLSEQTVSQSNVKSNNLTDAVQWLVPQKLNYVMVSSNRCLPKRLGTQPPYMLTANRYLSSLENFTIGGSPTHRSTWIYFKRSVRPDSTPSRFISTGYLTSCNLHMEFTLTKVCSGIPLTEPRHLRFRDRSP